MQRILNVRIDDITLKEATETIIQWAQDETQRYVTTPNPEIVLKAQKDPGFLKTLNRADLNIPDGTGILWAAKFLKITEKTTSKAVRVIKWLYSLMFTLIFPPYIRTVIRQRVTGADLMLNVCRHAPKGIVKIFLLGAEEGIADKVSTILTEKYHNIEIVGTHSGSAKIKDEQDIVEKIGNSRANLLFVAFGAPQQEIWIERNLRRMPHLKVAIGVGGTFDFIAGVRKRAPKWMQRLGLEWLYRVIQQPKRLLRIYNAIIKFPVAILKTGL